MNQKLSELATEKPRENSGSKTLARYDFQVHVSILRVLDLYKGSDPFVALFDHFDDLVLIVGPVGAEQISFLQIKSKEGTWKLSELISRPKKSSVPKSILGKIYQNVERFQSAIKEAMVVSNAPLSVTLADKTKTGVDDQLVSFQKLSESDHKKVVKALEADFGAPLKLDYRSTMSFERVALDLASFRQTVKGHIAEFLEAHGVHGTLAVSPAYEALHSELMRKTGDTITCETLEHLYARKALDRDKVSALLTRAASRPPSVEEWWPTLLPALQASINPLELLRLRSRCMAYWSKRSLGGSVALKLSRDIEKALSTGTLDGSAPVLAQVDEIAGSLSAVSAVDDEYDARAAVLVELAEQMSG